MAGHGQVQAPRSLPSPADSSCSSLIPIPLSPPPRINCPLLFLPLLSSLGRADNDTPSHPSSPRRPPQLSFSTRSSSRAAPLARQPLHSSPLSLCHSLPISANLWVCASLRPLPPPSVSTSPHLSPASSVSSQTTQPHKRQPPPPDLPRQSLQLLSSPLPPQPYLPRVHRAPRARPLISRCSQTPSSHRPPTTPPPPPSSALEIALSPIFSTLPPRP